MFALIGLDAAAQQAPAAGAARQAPPPAAPAAPAASQAAPSQAAPPAQGLPRITFEDLAGRRDAPPPVSMSALGLGAIGGTLVFNGLQPVLGIRAGFAGVETALAVSRVYAVSSAVVGAVIGQWLYERAIGR